MTRNLRIQLADLAEAWLRAARPDLSRERATDLISDWPLAEPWDEETTALVLDRFPAELVPVAGVHFLPQVQADAAVLVGEVTSPYGPCSGLTPDLRNNTCTNFAAEYVSFPSSVPPATEYRRLCTSCADAAPDRISRRPLTTAPGGYPVERAS